MAEYVVGPLPFFVMLSAEMLSLVVGFANVAVHIVTREAQMSSRMKFDVEERVRKSRERVEEKTAPQPLRRCGIAIG
jgi:hypothetical protein